MFYKIAYRTVYRDKHGWPERRGYIYDFRTSEQPEEEFATESLSDAYGALEAARAYAKTMGYNDTTYSLVKISVVETVIE